MGAGKGQHHIKHKAVPTGSLSHPQSKGGAVPRRKAEGRVVETTTADCYRYICAILFQYQHVMKTYVFFHFVNKPPPNLTTGHKFYSHSSQVIYCITGLVSSLFPTTSSSRLLLSWNTINLLSRNIYRRGYIHKDCTTMLLLSRAILRQKNHFLCYSSYLILASDNLNNFCNAISLLETISL